MTSSAWSMVRGTLSGSLSRRWIAASMPPACMVENVVCPVFIAWKSVWASLPRTSPTRMYSGRCRIAALRRSNIPIGVPSPSETASRVTLATQFSWESVISRVSSMETTFASGGMKRATALSDVVFPDAVPPTKSRLLLFSIAIQK